MRGRLTHTYLIALGSNMRTVRHGLPRRVIAEAARALEEVGELRALSPIIRTAPLGPSARRYANACALIDSPLEPDEMLRECARIERRFARRRRGRRWNARTLDLDIVLWSAGIFASAELQIPHPRFRSRGFVLEPAAAIAPGWRDPVTGLTLAQLKARLTSPRPIRR